MNSLFSFLFSKLSKTFLPIGIYLLVFVSGVLSCYLYVLPKYKKEKQGWVNKEREYQKTIKEIARDTMYYISMLNAYYEEKKDLLDRLGKCQNVVIEKLKNRHGTVIIDIKQEQQRDSVRKTGWLRRIFTRKK